MTQGFFTVFLHSSNAGKNAVMPTSDLVESYGIVMFDHS